jgi:hypothetical protein
MGAKVAEAGLGCLHLDTMDAEGLGPKDIAALGLGGRGP